VKASLPGGCAIGGRPINIHLEGFRALGARDRSGARLCRYLFQEAERGEDSSRFPQRGATENLMMAASLVPGKTEIQKCRQEPENCGPRPFLERDGRARLGSRNGSPYDRRGGASARGQPRGDSATALNPEPT